MCNTQQILLLYMVASWALCVPVVGILYFGFTTLECIQEKPADTEHVVNCIKDNYAYTIIWVAVLYFTHVIFLTLLYFSRREYNRHTPLIDINARLGDL